MTEHRIDVGAMRQVPLTPRAVITRVTDEQTCTICEGLPHGVPCLANWQVASEGFTDFVCNMHLHAAVLEALPPRTMT